MTLSRRVPTYKVLPVGKATRIRLPPDRDSLRACLPLSLVSPERGSHFPRASAYFTFSLHGVFFFVSAPQLDSPRVNVPLSGPDTF